jgi:chromosomal replication initiator protein
MGHRSPSAESWIDVTVRLNPRHTFDTFIVGSSNRVARDAALAAAEAPGQANTPLFIYGETGLGKTHLLHAVANHVRRFSPQLRAHYVTSEVLLRDFIDALRDQAADAFERRYCSYDVLLVDDVQLYDRTDRIREEFFRLFSSVHEAGGQLVLSSGRPPRDLPAVGDALRSRFGRALVTSIEPPDLETRIAFLRNKVNRDGIEIDDPEVLTFIANRASTNIRQLEGALTRVVAFA